MLGKNYDDFARKNTVFSAKSDESFLKTLFTNISEGICKQKMQ